jgi:putative peptidoglycan binding protein
MNATKWGLKALNKYYRKSNQLRRQKIIMRIVLVLTCCLALAGIVRAEKENNGKPKKNKAKVTQQSAVNVQPGQRLTPHNAPAISNAVKAQKLSSPNNFKLNQNGQLQSKSKFQSNAQVQGKTHWSKGQYQGNAQAWQTQKFTLHKNSSVPSVNFQANVHINGAQNWRGPQYNAFRIYASERHDRDWWRARYPRVVLVGGGYYYWNNGYWYPAWGYDPSYESYPYDGPIYGYNDLPPDQVIANVQAALQAQGYYQGEVDGLLGPLTRAALARYQQDHGLYITSAIDQPTLSSLGMA